ncbi:MAG: FHA domain-containing protein [Clostridiales bacterium]|nr:FHA domain-containing protein [Clostridiales bacterium]
MNHLKRIVILSMALLLLAGGQAVAAAAPTLQAQGVFADGDGLLNAVVYTTVEGNLQTSDFALKLNGVDLTPTAVSSYYRAGLGASYLFLLDAPRAMKSASFTLLKDTVSLLIDRMGDADNAAILTTGGSVAGLTLTSGKSLLKQALDGIEKGAAADTLNASVADAANYLQSAVDARRHVCLVVLTTGETRDETGMTQAELQKLVTGMPLTVYTYAFVTDETESKRVKQANDFGALARQSVGGVDTLVTGKTDAAALAGAVTDNEKRFLLLTADMSAEAAATGAGTLTVSLQDGGLMLSDETAVSAALLAAIQPAVTATPDISPNPDEPTPTPTGGHIDIDLKDGYLIYILAGLGALLAAMMIALIVVSRRRKRSFELDNAPDSDLNGREPARDGAGHTQITEDDLRTEPVMEKNAVSAKLRVTLTQVGTDAEQKYTADMLQTLVIGRSSREARLVIPKDTTISGTHAKLTFDGSAVRIEDLNSANGTKINGVKIQMPTVLHSGDVLTFGKTSLRVTWQRL